MNFQFMTVEQAKELIRRAESRNETTIIFYFLDGMLVEVFGFTDQGEHQESVITQWKRGKYLSDI